MRHGWRCRVARFVDDVAFQRLDMFLWARLRVLHAGSEVELLSLVCSQCFQLPYSVMNATGSVLSVARLAAECGLIAHGEYVGGPPWQRTSRVCPQGGLRCRATHLVIRVVSQWLDEPWWNQPGILLVENTVGLLSIDDGQILELPNHVTDTAGFVPSVFRLKTLEYGSRSPRGRVCIVAVRRDIFEALGQLPAPPGVSREPDHQNVVDIVVPSVGRSDECKSLFCEFTSHVPCRPFTGGVVRPRELYAKLCIGADDRVCCPRDPTSCMLGCHGSGVYPTWGLLQGGGVAELLVAENLRLVGSLRGAPRADLHLVDAILRLFALSDTAV